MSKPQLCIECHRRPKARPHHRCAQCYLRHRPIGEQVEAARVRLSMVPEPLRLSRRAGQKDAPEGYGFCAGCQSYRDEVDFAGGATRCKPCASAKAHGSMIEKTYGLSAEQYDELLKRQGGRCAVCRARPKSKRLAVDHDHKSGHVRGLLCGRCNHDLLGSAWDSLAMVTALWHYLNTPPTSGDWLTPEKAPSLAPVGSPESSRDSLPLSGPNGAQIGAQGDAEPTECTREHFLPAGAQSIPGMPGVYRVFVSDDPFAVSPF